LSYLRRPYRGVEQLVARRAHNPKAVGSSPAPATRMQARAFGSGFSFLCASEVHFGEQEKMKNGQQLRC
jgi:hypothetical protein